MTFLTLTSILLVDDDEISNLFNRIFIGKLNLNVKLDVALNGKEAIALLKPVNNADAPITSCMLLLDIKMPIMDGWQFLEVFDKELNQAIKEKIVIIMLTTSEDEQDMIKAMNNPNVKEFIQKPLSENAIKKLIDKYFSNTKMDK